VAKKQGGAGSESSHDTSEKTDKNGQVNIKSAGSVGGNVETNSGTCT
jgi:hypothetical protein